MKRNEPSPVGAEDGSYIKKNVTMGIVTQRSIEMEEKEKISAISSAEIRDQIGTEFLDMTIQHIQLLKQEEHVSL